MYVFYLLKKIQNCFCSTYVPWKFIESFFKIKFLKSIWLQKHVKISTLEIGDPSLKTITSTNVESAFPLNLCLSDASTLDRFNVWDGRKWRSDPTLRVSCTFFYWQIRDAVFSSNCTPYFHFEIKIVLLRHNHLPTYKNSYTYLTKFFIPVWCEETNNAKKI